MNKLNFLLIDDDNKTLELLKRDLNELDVAESIATATDGEEAMRVFSDINAEGRSVDVIFCDIVMPVCNGIEFLERFRDKFDPDHNQTIVMLTSKSDKSLVLKTISFGVNHYLLKPWNKQGLMQKIMESLKPS